MKTGIVVCTRLNSSRVPGKAVREINGVPLIRHLVRRLKRTGLPVVLALPQEDLKPITDALGEDAPPLGFTIGHPNDPLARTYQAAKDHGLDRVVRVSHDKIFVSDLLSEIEDLPIDADYCFSPGFAAGTGFEVISFRALRAAAEKYKNVEFIGYAVKSVTDKIFQIQARSESQDDRLLIDFPEDLSLMELILASCGNDCTTKDALEFLKANPWARKINRLPRLTLYTCVYNGEKFIERAMGSVSSQNGFRDFEYIIVDDHSTDRTTKLIAKFCTLYPNARWIRNRENLGLASSSNIALKNARSEFIMRLDADDYFSSFFSAQEMLNCIQSQGLDAVYPDCYFGSKTKVQPGSESHHVGGAIFRTRAVNHVKFTERLRGYEGLDFFVRAKDQIKIGYFSSPTFFYTQRPDSLSKTNLEERAKIKEEIDAKA